MRYFRWLVAITTLALFAACGTGIDAGGETLGENGGVAWILMASMLLAIGAILWWVIGRDE